MPANAVPTVADLRAELRAITAQLREPMPWPAQLALLRKAQQCADGIADLRRTERAFCAELDAVLP